MPHLSVPRAGMQFLEKRKKKSDKGSEVRTEIVKEKKEYGEAGNGTTASAND